MPAGGDRNLTAGLPFGRHESPPVRQAACMMRRRMQLVRHLRCGAILVILLVPATGALASGSDTTRTPSGVSAGIVKDPSEMRGLVGKSIETPDGKQIGKVRDILVRERSKADLVVSVGGFLGIGDKLVTIPQDEVTMSSDGLVVTMTAEQLRRAPAYDPTTAEGTPLGATKRK